MEDKVDAAWLVWVASMIRKGKSPLPSLPAAGRPTVRLPFSLLFLSRAFHPFLPSRSPLSSLRFPSIDSLSSTPFLYHSFLFIFSLVSYLCYCSHLIDYYLNFFGLSSYPPLLLLSSPLQQHFTPFAPFMNLLFLRFHATLYSLCSLFSRINLLSEDLGLHPPACLGRT